MSESNVTEKDVFDAADQMLAAGEHISNRTVLHKLRRGSMSTICPLLRHWRELRKIAPKTSGEAPPLPDSVMDVAKDLVNRLRQLAQLEAKQTNDAASVVLADQISIAWDERDSAIADAEAAEADLKVVILERDMLQKECIAADAQVFDCEDQTSDATARATAAEMREGELRKHAEDLKSELANAHRLHQEERARSDQLRNEVAKMRSSLDANVLVIANAVADANHARALAVDAKERIEEVEAAATIRINAMEAAREQARRDAKESGELAAGLQRELVAVKQKSDDFYRLIKGEKSRIGKSAGKRAKSDVN